jgi:hypothetical protein
MPGDETVDDGKTSAIARLKVAASREAGDGAPEAHEDLEPQRS